MPPFALVAIGIVLRALTSWLRLPDSVDPESSETGAGEQTEEAAESAPLSLAAVLHCVLAAHVLGALVLAGLPPLTRLLAVAGWPTEQTVFAGLLTASGTTLLLPAVTSR